MRYDFLTIMKFCSQIIRNSVPKQFPVLFEDYELLNDFFNILRVPITQEIINSFEIIKIKRDIAIQLELIDR